MKRQRLVPILVISASIALLYVAFLAAGPPKPAERQSEDIRPTTFSSDSMGTKALYLVLEHFLPDVERWMKPMQSLDQPAGNSPTTLLVMQPLVSLDQAEAESLDAWVSDGGQLIVATDTPWSVRGDQESPGYLSRHGFTLGVSRKNVRLYAGRAGSLLLNAAPLGGEDHQPVFSGPSGTVAAERAIGSGRIIVIADGGVWSNARLKESNNAAWLVLTAGTWKNGRLLVDEYHLGNMGGRGTLQLILTFLGTFWGMVFLQVGLAAVLHLLGRVRHFGPARDLPRERVQDPLERVRGIGAFLQAAEAREFSAQVTAQLVAARRHTKGKEHPHE
ncbi:MAG TPA: DUF4350 domain-containing protein [Spirochaetia bacterium]|nr:DUF4350 domain-containing protein [Spirochaetia bacterium]